MKKKQLSLMVALFPLLAFSQTAEESVPVPVLEQAKDSTEFVSIEDIIKEKEETTIRSNAIMHFDQVWTRRSFFNIGYNVSTLAPKETIPTGMDDGIVQNRKSNYGFSLQYGRSYRLHKKPIKNILQFYVDYTPIDVSFSHYKIGSESEKLYNSAIKRVVSEKNGAISSYYYIPWDLEKFEGSYGMSVGPSFTVLPFAYIKNNNGLHFLKFNMYFRVGYQASILYMANDDNADINTAESQDFQNMSNNLKMNWGHGLLTTFGLSVTWKYIGIGYEHRVAQNKYKSVTTRDFGSDTYKFKTSTDRIFISFRMGR